jgi:tripartite-type tricarboxylate transporter receptor subunit TctC
MFKAVSKANLQHVPYKGSAPAVIDAVGGHLQLMFDPLQSVIAQVQAGKLRAIAVSSATRAAVLPNVPTIAESGYAGFETTAWWGVFAPSGLPPPLAASLAAESERIVRGNGFGDKLSALGVVPTVRTLGAFAEFQKSELAKWGKAVRDSGATVD